MGSSILQAILGGVAGGASGITAVREQRRLEEEQRQKAEEAKRQAERQAMLDRIGLVEKGFVPESSAGAMDMPGATPRTPFMRQALASGEQMVMERSPQMRAHETEMRKATTERGIARAGEERTAAAAEQRSQSIDAALEAAGIGSEQRGLVRSGALKASDVMPKDTGMTDYQRESLALRRAQMARERGTQSAAMRATTDTMLANEAEGLEFLERNRGNPQVMQALNTVFANRPELSQRPGLAGYALKRSTRTEESDEMRREQAEARRQGQAGSGLDAIASRYGVSPSGPAPSVPAPDAQLTPAAARPAMAQPAMTPPAAPAARPDTQPSLAPSPAARPDTQPAPAARPSGTFSSMAGMDQPPEEVSPMDDPELRAAKEIIAQGAPRDEVVALYEQRTGKRWPEN
jgi:hypothetical protein